MTHPEFVETKDVKFLELREKGLGESKKLYIKGLIFHSALAVKRVEIRTSDGIPWILISLTPAAPGLSGAFEVEVPIREVGLRILFGPQKDVIWPVSGR